MNNYVDIDLLGNPYKLVASGWDSLVFTNKEDPDQILKLYDFLTKEQIVDYYKLHDRFAQLGIMESEGIRVEVLNPLKDKMTRIIDHEDGVLVVLPRVDGINLSEYGTDIEATRILGRVKNIMENHGLSTTGGFEVKAENLIVVLSGDSQKIHIIITDLGARIGECLGTI